MTAKPGIQRINGGRGHRYTLIGLTVAAVWAYICRPMFRRLREATQ